MAAPVVILGDEGIPKHPAEIKFPALDYKVPPPEKFRATLSNGMVVYIAEDRMLPTFDLTVTLRVGRVLDPADKVGLYALLGEQVRDGGTQNLTPEDLDERIEFLAATVSSSVGDTSGSASLSCLSKDVDEALALFVEILRTPRFDETRLRKAKDRVIQNIPRRNDSTDSIAGIEWGFQLDGEDHYSNRFASTSTINSIGQADLLAAHKQYYHPGNMMVAVAGDFDRAAMLAKLDKAFSNWPSAAAGPKNFPAPTHEPKPGVYLLHKEGVNQGRVTLGHKGIVRGGPDEFALLVMNSILGGGGFRSRLIAKVRSDEGLAYNVGSAFGQGIYYPGDFRCWFQSKSNSCAYAARIVLDEVQRIRSEPIPQQDLDDAVSFIVESFPQRFQSKMAMLSTYVLDEYTGRDPSYWPKYVENIKRVSPADVSRVAQKYLHPDKLVIVAVGDAEGIAAGGHDKAPDLKLEALGKVTKLPLRDPDSMRR